MRPNCTKHSVNMVAIRSGRQQRLYRRTHVLELHFLIFNESHIRARHDLFKRYSDALNFLLFNFLNSFHSRHLFNAHNYICYPNGNINISMWMHIEWRAISFGRFQFSNAKFNFLFCYVIVIFTPTNAIRFLNLSENISQNIIRKIELFFRRIWCKDDLIEMVRLVSLHEISIDVFALLNVA